MLQDKRFKNRELQIMKMLDHVNVTTLHHFFYNEGDKVHGPSEGPLIMPHRMGEGYGRSMAGCDC